MKNIQTLDAQKVKHQNLGKNEVLKKIREQELRFFASLGLKTSNYSFKQFNTDINE